MKYINFHTHCQPEDPGKTLAIISCVAPEPLQEGTENMWLSYGIHPWYIHGNDIDHLVYAVNDAARDDRVLAIGEAGLDKMRGPALGLQKKLFCKQIDISERLEKPLIIHSVKANSEILELRKKLTPSQPWILHGFGGHTQEMQQFTEAGMYLSFGPKILYPQGKVADSLREVPEDKFFLETDHTNKSIIALYQRASEIREISKKRLEETIKTNFNNIFNGINGMA